MICPLDGRPCTGDDTLDCVTECASDAAAELFDAELEPLDVPTAAVTAIAIAGAIGVAAMLVVVVSIAAILARFALEVW